MLFIGPGGCSLRWKPHGVKIALESLKSASEYCSHGSSIYVPCWRQRHHLSKCLVQKPLFSLWPRKDKSVFLRSVTRGTAGLHLRITLCETYISLNPGITPSRWGADTMRGWRGPRPWGQSRALFSRLPHRGADGHCRSSRAEALSALVRPLQNLPPPPFLAQQPVVLQFCKSASVYGRSLLSSLAPALFGVISGR